MHTGIGTLNSEGPSDRPSVTGGSLAAQSPGSLRLGLRARDAPDSSRVQVAISEDFKLKSELKYLVAGGLESL